MTYDGVLIEEAIPGYRTLSIEGRQFNENDLESFKKYRFSTIK